MIYRLLLKLFLWLHSFSYKAISRLVVLVEGGLHPKHRIIGYHRFFVHNIAEKDRVLDVGCGNGALTYALAQKAKKVVAIDLSPENIRLAKERFSAPNVEYRVGDATKELGREKFDVIVLSNVLEHLDNRVLFLRQLRKIGPKLLIRVPALDRDWLTLYKKELGSEWRLDKTHRTEYTLKSLRQELKQAGWRIINYSIQFGEIWAVAS